MTYPESLPWMIEWLTETGVVLTSLPRNETAPPRIAKHYVPCGVKSWKRASESEWQHLNRLPLEWLPFLSSQETEVVEES